MDVPKSVSPQILSLVPGRVRVHLPQWSGADARELEARLACVEGIHSARANSLTGNVLIHFDPQRLSIDRLRTILSALAARFRLIDSTADHHPQSTENGSAALANLLRSSGSNPVVQAAVRGALGHAAVDLLIYGVAASAYALGWRWVAGLGVAHLVLDTVVWSKALLPLANSSRDRPGAAEATAP
jgi:hypothetical protein